MNLDENHTNKANMKSNMNMRIGDYAFVKDYYNYLGIGKIRNIHTNGFYEKQVEIVFKNSTHSVNISKVVYSNNLKELEKLYREEYK